MEVQISHGRGNFEGKGRPSAKYRQTLRLSVQKRLNRSRCRMGFGSDGPTRNHVLDGGANPPLVGAILGERTTIVKYRDFLP